ncbi:MAG: MFS transporter [Angustibacter sp.]
MAAWGLLISTAFSGVGNAVVAVAIPWLVLTRTGSATLVGVVSAAALVPFVVAALLGGAVVDRWGRLRSSITADLLGALSVAAIPLVQWWSGRLDMVALAALVALGAVFDGPGGAAREALRPDVARRAGWTLDRINARGEALDGGANLVGPGLAALLIAGIGPIGALWVTVGMFVFAAGVSAFAVGPAVRQPGSVPVPSPQTRPQSAPHPEASPRRREPRERRPAAGTGNDPSTAGSPSARRGLRRYAGEVAEGVRAVWHDPALRATTLLGAVLVMALAPLDDVLLPVHLQRTGRVGDLGLVLTAFAAGGILGTLGYPWVAARLGRRRTLLVSLAGLSVGLLTLALLPPLGWLVAIAAVVGLVAGPIGPITAVVMQNRTPEPLRARVISTTTSLALAAAPASLVVAGPLVDAVGVGWTTFSVGIGCLIATAYAWRSPGLRLGVET